jgi:hypothetical protein
MLFDEDWGHVEEVVLEGILKRRNRGRAALRKAKAFQEISHANDDECGFHDDYRT